MAKSRTEFRCLSCGGSSPKWVGRCPSCDEWNTLSEEVVAASSGVRDRVGDAPSIPASAPPVPLAEVDLDGWAPRPTWIGELDRVLGGGFVPGSVTLVGGEPGIGKSTLLLQALASSALGGSTALLVTAEESAQQVRHRAVRLGADESGVLVVAETSLPDILAHAEIVGATLVVIDSIQTIYDPDLGSAPGTVVQVRECAQRLVMAAKQEGISVVLVGHVTKDGALAGPRVLEHVVDTVLSFDGDRHHSLRLLRATKHRFGPTHELGLFEMTEGGLVGVPDAGGLFLADRRAGVPGSVIVPAIEGTRPLLVEVQGLVASTDFPQPRRSAQGLDSGRLGLLLAVLERRVGVSLGRADVYVSAVGGVRLSEPAADLPVALAVASATSGVSIGDDVVAFGEVGLAGELRQVGQSERRLAEAARLGFGIAVIPFNTPDPPDGMVALRARTLAEAVSLLGLAPT